MTTNPTPTVTECRLVASYQLFGDVEDGAKWMSEVLASAVKHGELTGFNVTGDHPGQFGIRLVTFTADVSLTRERFSVNQSYDAVKEAGIALLNEILADSDVQVEWVSPIQTSVQKEI